MQDTCISQIRRIVYVQRLGGIMPLRRTVALMWQGYDTWISCELQTETFSHNKATDANRDIVSSQIKITPCLVPLGGRCVRLKSYKKINGIVIAAGPLTPLDLQRGMFRSGQLNTTNSVCYVPSVVSSYHEVYHGIQLYNSGYLVSYYVGG